MLVDQYGRQITYLRVSITDRCNLRCIYCVPPERIVKQPRQAMMRYEEIAQVIRVAAENGTCAVRLTGVLGFPSVPEAVRNACVDMAREAYRQGPGGGPAQVGTSVLGAPVFLTGFPNSFRKLTAPGSPYLKRRWVG